MAKPGDQIHNPVTGERLIFRDTRASTNNELLRIEALGLKPGFSKIYHIHPTQEERHEMIAGRMGVRIAGKNVTLGPGDHIVFPPGVPHNFWNEGGDDIHFITEFRPAGVAEEVLEGYFSIAKKGLANKKGQPPLLLFAVLLNKYPFGYLAGPPLFIQRVFLSIGAFIGRLFGHKADHPYPHDSLVSNAETT